MYKYSYFMKQLIFAIICHCYHQPKVARWRMISGGQKFVVRSDVKVEVQVLDYLERQNLNNPFDYGKPVVLLMAGPMDFIDASLVVEPAMALGAVCIVGCS